ncbi:hypothetical protein D3C86_2071620 [compost metagenome]
MLDRRGAELVADFLVDGDARIAIVAEYADLDQVVGGQAAVDLGQYGTGQAFGADHHDRVQGMGTGAQVRALGRD